LDEVEESSGFVRHELIRKIHEKTWLVEAIAPEKIALFLPEKQGSGNSSPALSLPLQLLVTLRHLIVEHFDF
jgi:hypothetical protein